MHASLPSSRPDGLFEYLGVLHVHSTHSDGSGSVREIVSAAQGVGVDFLVLSDHNGLQAKADGWEGWHGRVLVSVGEEVSSRWGHCLAFGTSKHVNHRQPLSRILEDIETQKGLSFVAHPHGVYRPLVKLRDHSWKDWRADRFSGLELWSYMFDWVRDFKYHRFFRHYVRPDERIRGPLAETLRIWDRMGRKRRVVGIGSVDAHARRFPLLPFVVFPYADLFKTIRTHILTANPLTGAATQDTSRLLEAVRSGRCFIAFDSLADASTTCFRSTDGRLQMGDEIRWSEPVDLTFSCPVDAQLTILRDGVEISRRAGTQVSVRADRTGVYRAEARIDGRPWIFTNPIYLRPKVESQ